MGNCQNSVREIGESSGTSNTNHHNVMHVNTVDERIIRQRVNPRSAINFHEQRGVPNVQLCPPRLCSQCQARLFHKKSSQICCMSGKIILPTIPVPAELLSLYTDQTPIGVDFRHNLRKLNHIHAFTSMGVHIDESLANAQQGVYTFRAQGSIYHKIGGLLPNGPFVHTLRSLVQREDIQQCALHIREQPSNRPQYCLPSASQVAAVIVGGEEVANLNPRDILVQSNSGELMTIMDTTRYYDPLQYPLLFPYGSYGWSINSVDNNGRTILCRAFYAYYFQIRPHSISIILLAQRLFQQFVVDNFVKIEANKLRWIRDHQHTIRAELYQGLQDCLAAEELNPVNVGKTTVLPSSFVGSLRDLNERYQDAMALVLNYGKPNLFITMTCNPSWKEIVEELLPGQTAQDRPDLITRIFHAKFEEFKSDVVDKGVLGNVVAYVYVVEFQKRGLPHVHMLLILDENDKLRSPEEYDKIVKAEIPDRDEEPRFNIQGDNSYPVYRRRGDRAAVPLHENSSTYVDNSWVVPYNPWLLLKFDCHINVEICSSIKSVNYLYKYVHKGVDRVSMEVRAGADNNEI
ncbi:uncharacterized protein LOC110709046 [Chenopodium quinoa]|uniref:uncharacterized protein LOC110709046 n=1 Tax=Chenopodium quinoa TaxID=63459 RepID=UPI000B784B56|nr:uncharacterized protein LOC110709046 [Chenopodium quinoa]